MREAAAMVADAGADLIDLNMGCPVRKVCKTGAGAALLDDPDKAVALAAAAREGSGLPVTAKLRPGRSPGDRAGVDAGAAAGRGGRRRRHRLPSAARLAAALGRPDYALARELAEAAARARDRLRRSVRRGPHARRLRARAAPPPSCSRAARSATRGASRACWAATRASRAHEEVADELETVIDAAEDHLGTDRAGRYLRKFYPWYAETLGLTRREREALVTAPTTAHARAALEALNGRETVLAA